MRLESHLQLLIQVLSPGGTLTRLQGSVSHPLARRRGEWKRRERGSDYIVSLEQETQLRVLQSTEKSLYTVQSNDVTPLILSCLHALRLCFLLTLFVQLDCFYRLPDSLRTLPLSRYLAALVSTRLIMLTFLFRLRFSRSRCLSLLSSLLDTYTRESSLQILTQTRLLLTKYYTKHLSANYQVTDASPYCIINRSICTCISSCR